MPRPADTRACAFPESRFAPLVGTVELEISSAMGARSRPEQVTGLLTSVFSEIDGQVTDHDAVERLSAGTREWLVQRAVLTLADPGEWFEINCPQCDARIDLQLDLRAAPCSGPGNSFPTVRVETSLGTHTFESPNGRHERHLADEGSDADPRRTLIALCSLEDDPDTLAQRYCEADLDRIDAALEASAPDVADRTRVPCPECGHETEALIDPLHLPLAKSLDVLSDVDQLARAYGWSEADILAMPTQRRRGYVHLIETRQAGRRP